MAVIEAESVIANLRGSTKRMLIGGDWVESASGETFESLDPATEEVLATVPMGAAEDIDRAVRAARAAFDEGSAWRRMSPSERGKIMHRVGDLILEHGDEFALLESLDNGKPMAIARVADVPLAADLFHYMSGWATTDPETTMGPLVSREQFDRVTGYISSGRADGATVHTGGDRVGDRGYFVQPTILTETRSDMKVEAEEIFGPVVAAIPFDDPREIIGTANNTSYGLGAGVFTSDIGKAYRTAQRLRAGTVWVNTWNVFDAAMPFGGYKQSGWGREMGHEALKNYLETKAVITDIGQ